MDRNAVVHRRPHFARRGEQVFFLVARKPSLELTGAEPALFDAIDGARTVADLARIHPDAAKILARWHEAQIVELVLPPVEKKKAPHLVVIEPHIDDAVLSVGGRILNRAGQRITILTLARWSNFTSYWFKDRFPFDLETVTKLRRREGALAARLIGAEHRVMDGLEANLRFVAPELWEEGRFRALYAGYQPYLHSTPLAEEVRAAAERLRSSIDALAPDQLWIPLGIGEHVDHRLTREACLEMIARDPERFKKIEVMLYEDLPYATQFPGHAEQLLESYRRQGGRFERSAESIAGVFDAKMRAVSVFASQWKIESLASSISGREELGHRMLVVPRRPPPSELGAHRHATERIERALAPWLADREQHREITVIAAGPFARFREETAILAKAFPKARIRALVLEDYAWQVGALADSRVEVELIPHRPLDWVRLFAKESLRRAPAVVIRYPSWTPKHRALNQAMLRALALRPRVLATSLAEVTALLTEKLQLEAPLEPERAWPERTSNLS